jgi:predicted aspartyl protease
MSAENFRVTRRGVLRLAMALSLASAGKVFALRDVSGRMLVDVQVNGQGPFSFLLASGASRSAVSSELAGKLGLAEAPSVDIASLESGALRLQGVQLPIAASEVIGAADGLLGVEGMARKKIDIDFQNGTAAILPTNTRGAPRGFRVVPA